MRIDIELDGEIFTLLDIELFDSVLTKEAEYASAWILTRHLDDILLRHPTVTCTLRYTALCGHHCNNSSC